MGQGLSKLADIPKSRDINVEPVTSLMPDRSEFGRTDGFSEMDKRQSTADVSHLFSNLNPFGFLFRKKEDPSERIPVHLKPNEEITIERVIAKLANEDKKKFDAYFKTFKTKEEKNRFIDWYNIKLKEINRIRADEYALAKRDPEKRAQADKNWYLRKINIIEVHKLYFRP